MYMGNQGLRPPLQSAIIRDDKSVSSKVTETTESGGFLAASLSQNGQGISSLSYLTNNCYMMRYDFSM